MLKLHFEALDEPGFAVLDRLADVVERGYLGGGTALALQIGHRRSYDFDIALPGEVEPGMLALVNRVYRDFTVRPVVDSRKELTVVLSGKTKLTFFAFPFPGLHPPVTTGTLPLYSLSDLASNKAYVIGRGGEWKDYVDLYFLVERKGLRMDVIIQEAGERFGGNFDEKLFWEQLVYWKDLRDFKIEYLADAASTKEIQGYFRKLVGERFRK